MASTFTQLNNFQKSVDGVYCADAQSAVFDYSDGAESEQALKKILTNTDNLASDSSELEEQIIDWPTEYHLSSVRANLLRCLDLSGVKRVLELGCGCGSITRYLGEQSQLQIDSIEGSPTRAALAALRCQGLSNVTISTANFNQVTLPENYYDLILFVGVTEYAGRFSDRGSDEQALQDLLSIAQSASTDNATTVIAIENRTGLKYLLGANEDHYARPFVGIQNYPEKTGIRTYTKQEWLTQISLANFSHQTFLYPFPDYKLPTQIIHDRALANKSSNIPAKLNDVFSKIKSRDYLMPFDLGEHESYLWQGLYEAGTLADHANSFLLLLSNHSDNIEALAQFDVKQFEQKKPFQYIPKYVQDELSLSEEKDNKISVLEDEIAIITESRSWRILDKIRPLLQILRLGRK